MFCIKCGSELPNDAKFCLQCGAKVDIVQNDEDEGNKRKQVFDGVVKKCPNCGATIDSFQTNCSNCGYELREQKANSFAERFAEGMNKIENEMTAIKSDEKTEINLFKNDGKGFWSNYVDALKEEEERISKEKNILNKEIQYIKNFPIPNSKEELYEFMIMAANNVDIKLYKKGVMSKIFGSNDDDELKLSNAWLSKMKMIYQKAKISIKDSSDFQHIESVYADIIKKTE